MLTEVMTAKEKHQSYRNFNKPLFISLIVATLLLVVGGTVGYLVSINKPNDFIGIGEGERQEDGAYELRDMFQLDDKHYTIMHESTMDEFGMSATINPEDIGEKIATITTSIDDRLINKEVYHYLPAQSEAVVAVKREETYQLFNFYNFESYEKNEDEDTRRYLEIFGMNEPADIKKIQFIHYGKDQKLNIITEITNSEEIA